jgi:preprotein translocase subunit Sec61beta
VRFARTSWRIKRHIHPTTIIGATLGIGVLVLIILTFNGTIEYTVGFIVLAVVILAKVGINILRNTLLK